MPHPGPTPIPPRPAWHRWRQGLRWLRITALLGVLSILLTLTWLRFAGLPRFLRTPLLQALARQGITANVSSLHFHWFRGVVAQNLSIAWGGPNGPRVVVEEADLDVAPPPWWQRADLIRGLAIRRGSVHLPLPLSNAPPRSLTVTNISASLRFLPDDSWEIRRFTAHALGLNLELEATLEAVSSFRSQPRDPDRTARLHTTLHRLLNVSDAWKLAPNTTLQARLRLHGEHPEHAHGSAFLSLPRLTGPPGELQDLRASLLVPPATTHQPDPTSISFELGRLASPHIQGQHLSGRIQLLGSWPDPKGPMTWSLQGDAISARQFRSRTFILHGTTSRTNLADRPLTTPAPWHTQAHLRTPSAQISWTTPTPSEIEMDQLNLQIDLLHDLAAVPPEFLQVVVSTEAAEGPLGSLGPLKLQLTAHPNPLPPTLPNHPGFWSILWPYVLNLELQGAQFRSPDFAIDHLDLAASWKAPMAHLHRLQAALYQGTLDAQLHLEVPSRLLTASARSTFDLHAVDPLLPPTSRASFQRYQWEAPPNIVGTAQITLPHWNDPQPDWRNDVLPSLRLQGRFEVGAGSFKTVPFTHATSSASFDGAWWILPDLRTERPEGRQDIAVHYHQLSKLYRVDARGEVFPPVLKPILGPHSAAVLDLFSFPQPVQADVSVWGPWSEGHHQSIQGTIHTRQFRFRDQDFDRLNSVVLYTNRTLTASQVHLVRETHDLQAASIRYAFDADRVEIHSATNTIHPAVIAAAISPGFPQRLAPYRFDAPPRIVANGSIHPRQPGSANLTFDIQGGPFRFWRLSAPAIQGRLLWQGDALSLSNLQADFYQGRLSGNAHFDIAESAQGHYQFHALVQDAQLADLLTEASQGRTNIAQGTFNLDLHITNAHTTDLHSWNGHGSVNLRDGLLWDAPLFGFLSPVLNTVVPGLGNNRAEHASATFTVTNSVFHTRNLSIACPPARLLYRGTIDFDQRVDARVEGQILSDLGGFGPLFGLVLRPLTKLLEFRVTGTLAEVEAEPLYVPRILLLPLQPVKILRSLFQPSGRDRQGDPDSPDEVPPPASPPPDPPIPTPTPIPLP